MRHTLSCLVGSCTNSSLHFSQIKVLSSDARGSADYNEAHITLARNIKVDDKEGHVIPFGVHLPSCQHCVVHDGNTVSTIEDSEW